MKFNSLIPEFSVTDINISKEFYESIGFKIKYERVQDKFCFLELEENQIMIEQINDNWKTEELKYPFGRGINISMTIRDVEAYYEVLLEKKIKIFKKLEIHKYKVRDAIYEDKEFLIQDPDGYLLRFNN